jgi:hypothetical protein
MRVSVSVSPHSQTFAFGIKFAQFDRNANRPQVLKGVARKRNENFMPSNDDSRGPCKSKERLHCMISDLITDLKVHRSSYIDCNQIFARLAGGDLTRFHYLAYLRETYHLVKHTPKYLTIAANRVADSDQRLADYFRKFSLEETGHELLCLRDIDALGESADSIIAGDVNPGVLPHRLKSVSPES